MAGHRFNPAKADKLISKERLEALPPEKVLSALDITKGEVVADLGAGNGFFTLPIAEQTGKTVYAVDIEPKMLELLQERAKEAAISNITYIESDLENTQITADSTDKVLIGFVMHEVPNRQNVLQEVERILTSNGVALLLEWEAVESEMGPPLHERLASNEFKAEVEAYGYRAEVVHFNDAMYGLKVTF
ncbi:methyltransferase domain-containing protein [Bacillus tianshenii]|nr:methyltransferase domain-containing protein [Bacillus tianshenii]